MTRTVRSFRRAPRPGFTLVELMVAAAVCVLIMAILATCFSTGIDTLRQLRSQGDMTDQLRAAEIVIKRDLQAKRFPADDQRENLGTRLSDLRYDKLVIDPNTGTTLIKDPNYTVPGVVAPPRGGFMRIKSCDPGTTPSGQSIFEGTDPDGYSSYRSTEDILHFTSILPGGTDQNLYAAAVFVAGNPQPILMTSPAAEIALFLDTTRPSGDAGNGMPLYNLVRRQRLVALTDSDKFTMTPPPGNVLDAGVVSVSMMTGQINSLADLTNPNHRLSGPGRNPNTGNYLLPAPPAVPCAGPGVNGGIVTVAPLLPGSCPIHPDGYLSALSGNRAGDDVLLSNVISFEVKVNWEPMTINPPFPWPQPQVIRPRAYPGLGLDNDNDKMPDTNTDSPFDYLPGRTFSNATGGFNKWLSPPFVPAVFNPTYVFDTWCGDAQQGFGNWNVAGLTQSGGVVTDPQAIPIRARVRSIQIRVRVFDPKLKNSRQLTIVQEM